jgi:AcrR family transcriptional regulator
MARTINPQQHAARRQGILNAAKTCFARAGFHGTSTTDICAEAGVSSGSLFHYFPNKKAVIVAIVEQEGEDTAQYLDGLAAQDDLHAALREFMTLILSLAADREFANLALEIAVEATRDADVGALVARNDGELRRRIERLVDEGVRRRQIDPGVDAASAAHVIAALVDGVFSRVAVDAGFRPEQQRETFLLMLDRLLRPTR